MQKTLSLAVIWTHDLQGTKLMGYQLSYPGLDPLLDTNEGVVLTKNEEQVNVDQYQSIKEAAWRRSYWRWKIR